MGKRTERLHHIIVGRRSAPLKLRDEAAFLVFDDINDRGRNAAAVKGVIVDPLDRHLAQVGLEDLADCGFRQLSHDLDVLGMRGALLDVLLRIGQKLFDADGRPGTVTPVGVVLLEVGDNLDVGAEKVRLAKEIEKIEKAVAAGEAKLSNETFVSKAPPQILEGARKQLTEAQAKRDELVRMLASLG